MPDPSSAPPSGRPFNRAIPFAIAVAAFVEALDSTIVATALPAIARDLGVPVTRMSSIVTAYLLAVTILIPLSGWIADRFGARRVFAGAILLFTFGSAVAAFSQNLPMLIAARALQGIGGALMMPVARLIVLRTIPRERFVEAMSMVTIPALIGPTLGPMVGGAITEWFGWHWIFLINLPIGVLGVLFVLRAIPDISEQERPPFDGWGFALFAAGLAGLVLACETGGRSGMGWQFEAALALGALGLLGLYIVHARRVASPAIDLGLFRIPTFRTSVLGGTLSRIGFSATPVLLPLLFQVAFGLSPLQSGSITFATAVGAILMKSVAPRVIRRFSFRTILSANAVMLAAMVAGFALFRPGMPWALAIGILTFYGFLRSLQFTFLNALAYADVPDNKSSHATSLASVGQQLAQSLGVAMTAAVLAGSAAWRGLESPDRTDFAVTFLVSASLTLVSSLWFARLDPDAGSAMRGVPRGVRRGAVQDTSQG